MLVQLALVEFYGKGRHSLHSDARSRIVMVGSIALLLPLVL